MRAKAYCKLFNAQNNEKSNSKKYSLVCSERDLQIATTFSRAMPSSPMPNEMSNRNPETIHRIGVVKKIKSKYSWLNKRK